MNTADLEEKLMAMEFAFMCLGKALHEQRVLPLNVLDAHLQSGAMQLQESPELAAVGGHLDALRLSFLQLQ